MADRVSRRHARPRAWFVGVLLALALWEVCTRAGVVGRTLLASPEEVLGVLWQALDPRAPAVHRVFLHAGATLGRAIVGWLFAVAAGVLIGSVGPLRAGSDMLVEFARAVPPIMVFPLFLVAFDYGNGAYIATIAFGCAPVVAVTVGRAVEGISGDKLAVLRVFCAGRAVRAVAVAMEVLPGVILGARLALSISIVVAVVTEMVFTPRSGVALGSMAKDAQMSFETPALYAAIVVIGSFGFGANRALRAVERRLGL